MTLSIFQEGDNAMKLGTKGRYAVMAMVDLAMQESKKPVNLSQIAERQEISLAYLEQLFTKLRRAKLVKSIRGPGGGYQLSYPSTNIRIYDIIMAVDESIEVTRCKPDGALSCISKGSRCLTHDLWDELGRQIHLYLNSVTLEDICEGRVLGTSRVDLSPEKQIIA